MIETTHRERVGLLGGSFNPIHHGHLYVAHVARNLVPLDRIVFIPASIPPHKDGRGLAPADVRVRMVEAAVRGVPGFEVSTIEVERTGKSYTIDTALALQQRWPDADLYFVIGSDSLNDLPTWFRIRELVELVTFVTIARSRGQVTPSLALLAASVSPAAAARIARHVVEVEPLPISSTAIRERVATARAVDHLVPGAVAALIDAHGLYRAHS